MKDFEFRDITEIERGIPVERTVLLLEDVSENDLDVILEAFKPAGTTSKKVGKENQAPVTVQYSSMIGDKKNKEPVQYFMKGVEDKGVKKLQITFTGRLTHDQTEGLTMKCAALKSSGTRFNRS